MNEITSVLGVDPGTTVSAWVHYRLDEDRVVRFGTCDNGDLLYILDVEFGYDEEGGRDKANITLVVEGMASYGQPVGASTFTTCIWIGRFIQAWGGEFVLYPRRRVKKVLLGKDKGGDKQVRQAVLSWFGGEKKAKGLKASPGPLHGMVRHEFQALALGLAYTRELRSGVAPPAVEP